MNFKVGDFVCCNKIPHEIGYVANVSDKYLTIVPVCGEYVLGMYEENPDSFSSYDFLTKEEEIRYSLIISALLRVNYDKSGERFHIPLFTTKTTGLFDLFVFFDRNALMNILYSTEFNIDDEILCELNTRKKSLIFYFSK